MSASPIISVSNTENIAPGSASQQSRRRLASNRPWLRAAAITLIAVSVVGCTSTAEPPATEGALGEVRVVVHDSFPNEAFAEAARAATGYDVNVFSAGDGGELTNKLVLTQGEPIADVFFGVDNVFASRVIDAGVAEAYPEAQLPESATSSLADDHGLLSPVTRGATCINIDPAWFAAKGMPEPESYADLAKPEYAELTVLLDPSSSSTGASFLIGTVAEFGENGFAEYWSSLRDGGVRIEQGWSEGYNGQFTQGGGSGTYPIVLSYSSSPAWTLNEAGTATTTAILPETCSSQVEYAGVIAGTSEVEGARAVVDYLLSREFQDTIAESMYVYPVDDEAYLPEAWKSFAVLPGSPRDLTPEEIGAGRERWLRSWSDATGW